MVSTTFFNKYTFFPPIMAETNCFKWVAKLVYGTLYSFTRYSTLQLVMRELIHVIMV